MDSTDKKAHASGCTTLHIKNMVCARCIMVVKQQLLSLRLTPVEIGLGKAVVEEQLDDNLIEEVRKSLKSVGFELLDDKKSQLVEQIRNLLVELTFDEETMARVNISEFLNSRLNHDYGSLSKLFSEVNGTTIERYFISLKIERVKELLTYGELSLAEIAYRLGYSSSAHLSAQFKSLTGMTPSAFRSMHNPSRKPLDKV